MRALFVLLTLVISACFAKNCKTATDCDLGSKCDGGKCKVRLECPMYEKQPTPKPGCKIETVLDDKKCPIHKQVSRFQNCKTTTDCGPGFKCDGWKCKARPECPMYTPPAAKPGCKIETVLDQKQCPKLKVVC